MSSSASQPYIPNSQPLHNFQPNNENQHSIVNNIAKQSFSAKSGEWNDPPMFEGNTTASIPKSRRAYHNVSHPYTPQSNPSGYSHSSVPQMPLNQPAISQQQFQPSPND